MVEIKPTHVKVIGRLVPGFTYKDIVPVEQGKICENLGPNEQTEYYTNLNSLSSEVFLRKRLFIYGQIVDINFIKFEFVCELCDGGTLLSIAKCINYCVNPRPVLKIFMRCTVQDSQQGEASISLRDQACCKIFGINASTIDVFKEYFFMRGVFFYKSMQPLTPEYSNVMEFFKNADTFRKFSFIVAPFCKVGYDNSDQAQAKPNHSGLTDRLH